MFTTRDASKLCEIELYEVLRMYVRYYRPKTQLVYLAFLNNLLKNNVFSLSFSMLLYSRSTQKHPSAPLVLPLFSLSTNLLEKFSYSPTYATPMTLLHVFYIFSSTFTDYIILRCTFFFFFC